MVGATWEESNILEKEIDYSRLLFFCFFCVGGSVVLLKHEMTLAAVASICITVAISTVLAALKRRSGPSMALSRK